MVFRYACTIPDDPSRGQLQRFVTSPPHDGGDLPSGLPPRSNSLPLFPAAANRHFAHLTEPVPRTSVSLPYRHRTYLIPSLHQLSASTSPYSLLPAPYLKTAPYIPYFPAIMESTTPLPNLFMPHPRDHSPSQRVLRLGRGCFQHQARKP